MRDAALARYDRNAEDIHVRVRQILELIKQEMASNGGIYPFNKGAISIAEVARRSQIHPLTFHKPRYVDLAKEVKAWLEALKGGNLVGRSRIRKDAETRIGEWKELYENLLDAHRVTETDLLHAQVQLEEARAEIDVLRARLSARETLKIASIHSKKD